jgi:hypothetical protein
MNQPGSAISQLDSLQKHLKSLLDREKLESIDQVTELITENYKLERDPAT